MSFAGSPRIVRDTLAQGICPGVPIGRRDSKEAGLCVLHNRARKIANTAMVCTNAPMLTATTNTTVILQMPCMACVHACSTWGECGSVVFNSVVADKRDLHDFCKCNLDTVRTNAPRSWRDDDDSGDDDEQRCAAGQSSSSKHRCKGD